MACPESLTTDLIAPCGMNCGLCRAYQRVKNRCPGCSAGDEAKPKSCGGCRFKYCAEIDGPGGEFCYQCSQFPCPKLKRFDKRYRTKYGMSPVKNLESIRDEGLEQFLATERDHWRCPECGGLICCHAPDCPYCGWMRPGMPRRS